MTNIKKEKKSEDLKSEDVNQIENKEDYYCFIVHEAPLTKA